MCLRILWVLGMLVGSGAWAQLRLVSDGNTRYSHDLNQPGWESPAFDDAGWAHAAIPFGDLCNPAMACVEDVECARMGQVCLDGYCTSVDAVDPMPIWGPNAGANPQILLRRTFDLAADTVVRFDFGMEGCGQVYVNGMLMYETCRGGSLPSLALPAGPNVIAMYIEAYDPCPYVAFLLETLPPPPPNDDRNQPVEIVLDEGLSFWSEADGSGSTREPTDPMCAWEGTLWYRFTPPEDLIVTLTEEWSWGPIAVLDLETGELLACSDGRTSIRMFAGRTYEIMVSRNHFIRLVVQAVRPAENDELAGAILIDPLPFHSEVDFSGASRAPDDPDPACSYNGWAMETVWYRFEGGPLGKRVILNGQSSDAVFIATLLSGQPGDLRVEACNLLVPWWDGFVFEIPAGTTRWLMVTRDSPHYGTRLVLDVSEAFQITGLVPTDGSVNTRIGVPTVRGTVTCNQPGTVTIRGTVRQKINRMTYANGDFVVDTACGPTPTPWVAAAHNDRPFVSGTVAVSVVAEGCGEAVGCDQAEAAGTVRLRSMR